MLVQLIRFIISFSLLYNKYCFIVRLIPEINSNITDQIEHQTHKLERHINRTDQADGTVYIGSAGNKVYLFDNIIFLLKIIGIALLYLHLAIIFEAEKDNYKFEAKSLIDSSLERVKDKLFGFPV